MSSLNSITAVILFSEISGNLGNAAVLSLTNGANIKRFSQLKLFSKKISHHLCDGLFWRRWRDSPASLPRSAARTRAPKQSAGLFLCFALPFSNLFILKKEQAQKCLFFFWRRWRDSNSRGGCPPYALSRGASSPA